MQYKNKIRDRDILVNQCDLFLPSSVEAKDTFYSTITTESFPIFTGLDPDLLNDHVVSSNKLVCGYVSVFLCSKVLEELQNIL